MAEKRTYVLELDGFDLDTLIDAIDAAIGNTDPNRAAHEQHERKTLQAIKKALREQAPPEQ